MWSMLTKTINPESPSKFSGSDDSSETIKPAKLPHHRTGLSDELQALTISDVNESRHASPVKRATKVQQPLPNSVDEILKSRPGLSASRWATGDFGTQVCVHFRDIVPRRVRQYFIPILTDLTDYVPDQSSLRKFHPRRSRPVQAKRPGELAIPCSLAGFSFIGAAKLPSPPRYL